MPTLVVLPAPLTPTTMITVGVCAPMTSGRSSGCEQLLDAARQQAPRRGRVANMGARHAPLQVVEKIDGGLGAGIGLEQRDLEVFVELVADLGADEGAGDRPAGALQAALQLGHPAGAVGVARRLGGDDIGRGRAAAAAAAEASARGRRRGSAGFLPKNSSPTSALSQSRALRGRCAAASPGRGRCGFAGGSGRCAPAPARRPEAGSCGRN